MPLDLIKNREEITQLSHALKTVAERQPSPTASLSFLRLQDRADRIAHGLEFATFDDPEKALGMRELCDNLAGACSALGDHVESVDGGAFWRAKKALLMGLADHFDELAKSARKTSKQDFLNLI